MSTVTRGIRGLVKGQAVGTAPSQPGTFDRTECLVKSMTWGLASHKQRNRGGERGRETARSTYHLFTGCQHLLYHHTVPCERAPVQRVGPIRTEGTQAWCGCRGSHGLPRQQSQWWRREVRRRRRRSWEGLGVRRVWKWTGKTNKNTLNACSFQEPDCMPQTTTARQRTPLKSFQDKIQS